MKKITALTLVLVLTFALCACGEKDADKLVIGYTIYEPMNYMEDGKLTGFEIDVYRDTDEDFDDVDIREFSDEIEQWVIDELIKIGCDTAKSVLAISPEELLQRTELEEETIDSVLRILQAEFEE